MTEVTNELPVHETYRNCEIYGLQPPERIIEARHQIDVVYRMRDPRALAAFACDETNSPEARLLAKHKALASRAERQRGSFDVDYLLSDEYRERAEECVAMAKLAKSEREKKALLQIALAWHELAETGKLVPPLTRPSRPKLEPK